MSINVSARLSFQNETGNAPRKVLSLESPLLVNAEYDCDVAGNPALRNDPVTTWSELLVCMVNYAQTGTDQERATYPRVALAAVVWFPLVRLMVADVLCHSGRQFPCRAKIGSRTAPTLTDEFPVRWDCRSTAREVSHPASPLVMRHEVAVPEFRYQEPRDPQRLRSS